MIGNVVTLYIDDTSLRLLVISNKGVKQWAELPLEPGMVTDGVITDEAKVATLIKDLLKTQKLSARRVIAGLSGRHCLSRLITLPRLPKPLLSEAVKREATRLIPVPIDQVYLSWQTFPAPGPEAQVFLIASPRNVADSLIRTLRQAGVEPYLMDFKPLALARVADKATAVIADVQATEIDIVVIVDRVPQLIRTIPLATESQSQINKIAVVEEELDRTIKFYNSSHKDNELSSDVPILVSGELAKKRPVKVDPNLMDLKARALTRMANKTTAIVADVQPGEINIVVIVDRVPQLIRTVPLPGEAQSQSNKQTLLEDERDRTIKFYNSSHTENPLPSDISLLVSEEPGKTEARRPLASELKSITSPLTSPLKASNEFDSSQYMVNIGLALKTISLSRADSLLINLNALPENYRPKQRPLTEVILVPSIIATAVFLAPLALMVQSASANTESLRNRLEATNQLSKIRQTQKQDNTELKKKVDEIVAARDSLSKAANYFKQQQEITYLDLDTMISSSSSVTLTAVSHIGNKLTVSGLAPDEDRVLGYAETLRTSRRFSQVVISSISRKDAQMVFQIILLKPEK